MESPSPAEEMGIFFKFDESYHRYGRDIFWEGEGGGLLEIYMLDLVYLFGGLWITK